MKRFLSMLLVLAFLLTFSACKSSDLSSATTTTASTTTVSQTESSKVVVGSSPVKTPSSTSRVVSKTDSVRTTTTSQQVVEDTPTYEELSCRIVSSSDWRTVSIKDNVTGMSLRVEIPNDWYLSKSGKSTLNIVRAGKNIGVITTTTLPKPNTTYEESDSFRVNIDAHMRIEKHTENGADTYYRSYQFVCYEDKQSFTLNMRVPYTELDTSAAETIMDTSTTILKANPFVDLSKTNGSKEILILGNSFISTSKIGSFLNDMLCSQNSEYHANAVSIGMASVTTFASDAEICNSIASGQYCYVFICGFYSATAITQLWKISDVCAASQTPLVIFPAHNESRTFIDSAVRIHRGLCFLDWKGEIDSLIESGVSYNDFCVNDYHKHSTPLAGYVGAHMIYRTLFGDPPALTANAPLTNQYVSSKLGDYVTTGGVIKSVKENSYVIN